MENTRFVSIDEFNEFKEEIFKILNGEEKSLDSQEMEKDIFDKLLNFIKENKDFLPNDCEKVFNILNAKEFESEDLKLLEIKKSILEEIFKNQENLDVLPNAQKSEAKRFLLLKDDEKREKALEYWDLVNIFVNEQKSIKKSREVKKANDVLKTSTNVDYAKKIFSLKRNLFSKNNNNN